MSISDHVGSAGVVYRLLGQCRVSLPLAYRLDGRALEGGGLIWCRAGGAVDRSVQPVHVLLWQLFLLSRFREENVIDGQGRKLSVVRCCCGTDRAWSALALP